MIIDPKEVATAKLHGYMLSAIAPRPIAFASTIDGEGNMNLAPYSFFNAFGSNPATLVFSPARRVRDNTIKHTLENVRLNSEVVINVVDYKMVQQMSLASCEYPAGTSEFVKAGFTPVASEKIKPFRVAESPVQFECKVKDIIETGMEGGAGNLIICEIVLMHINDAVLGEDGRIDANKIDLVARMGGDWYCRASGDALFTIPKPNEKCGIGFDQLPEAIRNSRYLTGNDLGQLANATSIPEADSSKVESLVLSLTKQYSPDSLEMHLHQLAHELLENNRVEDAWQVLQFKF
jgi:flavin reductase (DIM6/NTAB) family NADH-FMN oxidoreductase RutF